jgi:hypothetical protein
MSIFGFLGKAAKAVGKVAVGVVKVGVTAATGIQLGGGSTQPVAVPQGVQIQQPVQTPGMTTPTGVVGSVTGALNAFTDWIRGTSTPTVNANVGANTSNLPPWLPIAGVGLLAIMLFKSSGGSSRRY